MTPNTRTLKGQSYCGLRWANPVWPKGSKSRGFSNKLANDPNYYFSDIAFLSEITSMLETSKVTENGNDFDDEQPESLD